MSAQINPGDILAVVDFDPELVERVNGWLERGDGVALYRNHDLGHPHLGDVKLVSYGGPGAQLEVGEADPPARLPDIGQQINWRYVLVGFYRGEPIEATGV